MSNLLSRQDAALMLGISVCTLGRLIARGEIEAFRVGGLVRISPDALASYLEGHKLTAKDCNNVSTADTSNATADADASV